MALLDQLQDLQARMQRVEEALFGDVSAPALPQSKADLASGQETSALHSPRGEFYVYCHHRHGRRKYYVRDEKDRPVWSDNRDEAKCLETQKESANVAKLIRGMSPTGYSNAIAGTWKEDKG